MVSSAEKDDVFAPIGYNRSMVTLDCEFCGAAFWAANRSNRPGTRHRRQRFCSWKCAGRAKRLPIPILTCEWCGRTFIPARKTGLRLSPRQIAARRFCSLACAASPARATTSWHTCRRCGQSVRRIREHALRSPNIYCSWFCYHAWRREHPPAEVVGKPGGHYRAATWGRARRVALTRDSYRCRLCKAPGVIVHHIIPVREWLLADSAHSLKNLMTLCRRCHIVGHRTGTINHARRPTPRAF